MFNWLKTIFSFKPYPYLDEIEKDLESSSNNVIKTKLNISEPVYAIVEAMMIRPDTFKFYEIVTELDLITTKYETTIYDSVNKVKFSHILYHEHPDITLHEYRAPFSITRQERKLLMKTAKELLNNKKMRIDKKKRDKVKRKYCV